MNIRTLKLPRVSPGLVAAVIAAAMLLGAAALIARADTSPTLTNAIQNGSNVTLTSAPIGTAVHDTVTIASTTSSTTPTGTVNFSRFNNMTCAGTATAQSGVALVAGVAQSATTTVPATGLSYLVHYNGDASTTVADSGCKAITATAGSVGLSTAISASSVVAGSSVHDTATLTTATANATGTVAYNVYDNSLCTTGVRSAGTMSVNNAVVPNSNALQFNTVGTYYWQAVYSGDQNNSAVTSSCLSEPLSVVATTPPATTPGTINGTVYNDANGNDVKDASESGLSGWTVWLHMGTNHDGYNNPIIATATTDANGYYSFANFALGTYFVEEQEQTGWTQTSSDTKVVLSSTGATVDFANMTKGQGNGNGGHGDNNHATSTDNGTHHGDNDNHATSTDKSGNHDGGNDHTATSTVNGGHGLGGFVHDFITSHFGNSNNNNSGNGSDNSNNGGSGNGNHSGQNGNSNSKHGKGN